MTLAKFVRQRREGLGLSLNQLAMRSNCHKTHIHIEKGRAANLTVGLICGLAAGLQISAIELFRAAAFPSQDTP